MQVANDTRIETTIRKRRGWRAWCRFSLGSLFICLTIGGVALGFIANRAQRQRRAVEKIEQNGENYVIYEQDLNADGDPWITKNFPGPDWLRELVGVDYFANVGRVASPLDVRGDDQPKFDLRLLRDLPALRAVELTGHDLSNEEWQSLSSLTKLKTLELRLDRFSSTDLRQIAGIKSLERLTLVGEIDDEAGLKQLVELPRLRQLTIRKSSITDRGFSVLAKMPLEGLRLEAASITDAGVAYLEYNPTLRYLSLNENPIGNASLRSISTLTKLKLLEIAEIDATDEGLEHLKKMNNLRNLELSESRISNAAIKRLKLALPKCDIERVDVAAKKSP